MSHDPIDKRLDEALSSYVDSAQVSPESMAKLQASVMQQLEATDAGLLDWLVQAWWRPVLASALPLIFGFVVGLNSDIANGYPDIAGIVYFEGLEEVTIDAF